MIDINARVVCLFALSLVSVGGGVTGAEPPSAAQHLVIPRLASLSSKERTELQVRLVSDRFNMCDRLLQQLDPATDKEVSFEIAYLLGIYRMERAVSELSRYIAVRNDKFDPNVYLQMSLYGEYPIAEALTLIGNPSVRPMLDNLEASDDATVRKLSARVIVIVEGREIAKVVLEKAIEKQRDDAKKARLKAAIGTLDRVWP